MKWENVSFEKTTIDVKKAIKRVIEFDDKGIAVSRTQILSNTKTAKGVRSFIMPDIVTEYLKQWKERQKQTEVETGLSLTGRENFVFCNQSGEMRTYSSLRCLLKRFLKKNGFDKEGISLYTFRHTFATMLLEERENPKIVANLMGHSKVLTTLTTYSHVISNDVYEDTAKTLDGVYSKIIDPK